MEREELFLGTLVELESRTSMLASKYDAIGTTLLLRKLLLDGERNLTDAVGGGDGPYEVTGRRVPDGAELSSFLLDESLPEPSFWAQRFSYRETVKLVALTGYDNVFRPPRAELSRDEFLRLVVVRAGGHQWNVRELIYFAAYVLGGIHAGEATDADQRLLRDLELSAVGGGMSYLKETLIGIASTTLHAMAPVAERLKNEATPSRDSR